MWHRKRCSTDSTNNPRHRGKPRRDDLKRRIDSTAKYLPRAQLCLNPQCGFASTAEGNALTEDDQRAKLRLVVGTAEEVWRS